MKSFFGPQPGSEDVGVTRLEYTACAVTNHQENATKPNMQNSKDVLRVCFGDKCVIWWSAKTKSHLTRQIAKTFEGFAWNKEN